MKNHPYLPECVLCNNYYTTAPSICSAWHTIYLWNELGACRSTWRHRPEQYCWCLFLMFFFLLVCTQNKQIILYIYTISPHSYTHIHLFAACAQNVWKCVLIEFLWMTQAYRHARGSICTHAKLLIFHPLLIAIVFSAHTHSHMHIQ